MAKPYLKKEFVSEIRSMQQRYGVEKLGFLDQDHIKTLFKTPQIYARAALRDYPHGPMDMLPGVVNIDPRTQKFLIELGRGLHENFKPSLDELGRPTGTGQITSFDTMLHLPGFPQERANIPSFSNAKLREDKGLTNNWINDFDRDMFTQLCRLWFAKPKPVDVTLKDGSQAGIGFFTTDIGEKEDAMLGLIQRDIADIKKLFLKRDYVTLFEKYSAAGPSYTLFRDQYTDKMVDGKSAPRPVSNLQHAISSGLEGAIIDSSKSLEPYGSYVSQEAKNVLSASRRRVAYAQSLGYSAFLLPVAQATREMLYDKYSFTLHHTTRLQKEKKMKTFDAAVAADVSNHDILWPVDLYLPIIEQVMDELGYSKWYIECFRSSLKTGVYVPSCAPGEGGFMVGDWRDPQTSMGLLSGNPYTDLLGGLGMTFVYMDGLLTHVAPDRKKWLMSNPAGRSDWIEAFLEGKAEIAAPAKSDDGYLLSKGVAETARLQQMRAEMAEAEKKGNDFPFSSYMIVSYEKGDKFLGDVTLYSNSKDLQDTRFVADINSLPRNMILSEYGVYLSKEYENIGLYKPDRLKVNNRKYPGLAYDGRIDVYGSHELYEPVWEMMASTFNQHMSHVAPDFNGYMKKMAVEHTRWLEQDLPRALRNKRHLLERRLGSSKLDLSGLTPTEMMFINDPSVLQYGKIRVEDVRPVVLNLQFTQIDKEVAGEYFNHVFE